MCLGQGSVSKQNRERKNTAPQAKFGCGAVRGRKRGRGRGGGRFCSTNRSARAETLPLQSNLWYGGDEVWVKLPYTSEGHNVIIIIQRDQLQCRMKRFTMFLQHRGDKLRQQQ